MDIGNFFGKGTLYLLKLGYDGIVIEHLWNIWFSGVESSRLNSTVFQDPGGLSAKHKQRPSSI